MPGHGVGLCKILLFMNTSAHIHGVIGREMHEHIEFNYLGGEDVS
jgi:hypothetical protein